MFIFDTNVFDYLLDNQIDINIVKSKGELYTTNVQFSELTNIPNQEKQTALLELFHALDMKKLVLESGIFSDNLHWDDEQPWRDEVGDIFTQIVGNSRGWHDALIGEVAETNNLTLVTNDVDFTNRARRSGVVVLTPEEFVNT